MAAVNTVNPNRAVQPKSAAISQQERDALLGVRVGAYVKAFYNEHPAFWFLCFTYFIEYVRPQRIFPVIDVLPYGVIAIAGTLLFLFGDKDRQHPKNATVFCIYTFFILVFVGMFYAIDSQRSSYIGYIYLNWFLLTFLTLSLVTTERRFLVFLFLYLVWNFKMSFFGFRVFVSRGFDLSGFGLRGPQGWFHNSGEFGLQMAIITMIGIGVFLALRPHLTSWRYWVVLLLPASAFISTLGTDARGNYVGLAAGLLWLGFFAKGKRIAGITILLFSAGIAYLLIPQEMIDRFSVAGDDYTSYTRETRWAAGIDIFRDNWITGVGTGSWRAYYQQNFPREWGREGYGLPHNIFLDPMGEHGILGISLLLLIIFGLFAASRKTRLLAQLIGRDDIIWISRGFDAGTIALIGGGFFMSILYYPYLWVHAGLILCLHHITRAEHDTSPSLRIPTRPRIS